MVIVIVMVIEEAGLEEEEKDKRRLVVMTGVYSYERIIQLYSYCNTFVTKGLWEHFLLVGGGGVGGWKRPECRYLPLLRHTPSNFCHLIDFSHFRTACTVYVCDIINLLDVNIRNFVQNLLPAPRRLHKLRIYIRSVR